MNLRFAAIQGWWKTSLVLVACLTAFLVSLLMWPSKPLPSPAPTLPNSHFVRSLRGEIDSLDTVTHGANKPRVLCMVVTSPQYHGERASHLKATWGHWGKGACPNTVFLSSSRDDALGNVIVSQFSRYEDIWGKVLEGFSKLNLSVADWFVKADDDTFIIYPHLLELLAPLDPSKPVYLGLPLIYRPEIGEEITYMSGGSGYVVSRAALTRLQGTHVPACRNPGYTKYEDVNMGYCMAALGVDIVDTRDSLGRPRFLPYPPWRFLQPDPHPDFSWLVNFSKYKFHFGAENLSDLVVSFHEIRDPVNFYLLQYLIYDLKVSPPGSSRPFRRAT